MSEKLDPTEFDSILVPTPANILAMRQATHADFHPVSAVMADKCTPYEVDGEVVLIRGSGEMTDEAKGFMAEIVRAAIRKARADREAAESEGATE